MQCTAVLPAVKTSDNFQIIFFLIFARVMNCDYTLELSFEIRMKTHNNISLIKVIENSVYPANSSSTICITETSPYKSYPRFAPNI